MCQTPTDDHVSSTEMNGLPIAKTGACTGGGCGKCSNQKLSEKSVDNIPLLDAPDHVLSTLEKDGSRRWLRPSLAKGLHWHRRRIVAYSLIAFFVTLPHWRIGGKQAFLLDIPSREFTIFGHKFFPTDTPLLALGIIGVFLTVALATSLVGRVWCGWGCPQTVYMEFLFRPIDRLFEGTKGRGGKARNKISAPMQAVRFLIYLLLSMALAHTFLAYFVGVDRLAQWLRTSPFNHPFAFLVMGGTTVAMLFDFLFFREQLCLIACPYGRFQSVMLDRNSLIVGYDSKRGEPRGKVRKAELAAENPKGDCVDCNRCVAVCPTGIDIRNGLQMECINCTQCIDACNEVMVKVGKPVGLIRYTSQDEVSGSKRKILRMRPVLYSIFLTIVAAAFITILSTKYSFDARILRAGGNPFTFSATGELQNSMRLRLQNRSNDEQTYTVRSISPEGATIQVLDEASLTLASNKTIIVPILVKVPKHLTARTGNVKAELEITDERGTVKTVKYNLVGPRG